MAADDPTLSADPVLAALQAVAETSRQLGQLVTLVDGLVDRVDALERGTLRGVVVSSIHDDSPTPDLGEIIGRDPAEPEDYVWVRWRNPETGEPGPVLREALDELAPRRLS